MVNIPIELKFENAGVFFHEFPSQPGHLGLKFRSDTESDIKCVIDTLGLT